MSCRKKMADLLVLLLVVATMATSMRSVGGQEEVPSCVTEMGPCVEYLQENSTEQRPPQECCNAFKTMVEDDQECVCANLMDRNSPYYSAGVNRTRAAMLPAECDVVFGMQNCSSIAPPEESDSLPSEPSLPSTPGEDSASTIATALPALMIGGFFLLALILAA